MRFRPLGNRTRIAVIALAVGRFDHVALHEKGRIFHERVQLGRCRIGNQQHIGSLNSFPSCNRRAVKCMSFLEFVQIETRHRHTDMHFLASCIGKTEIDKPDFVFLNHLQDIFCTPGHTFLLNNPVGHGFTVLLQSGVL